MSTTPDPFNLLTREHFSAPTGRVEKRFHSPAKRVATADAQRLADALADFDEPTDDRAFQVGCELGWTPARTLAAIRSAMRTKLLDTWDD